MIQITMREWFLGNPNRGEAPLSIGSANILFRPDYEAFKQEEIEKNTLKEIKLNHRRDLKHAYPNGVGKHLNIPSKQLAIPIRNSF